MEPKKEGGKFKSFSRALNFDGLTGLKKEDGKPHLVPGQLPPDEDVQKKKKKKKNKDKDKEGEQQEIPPPS
jgi:hypothetical protein